MRCSGGCTWYAFAVGLHTVLACWRSDHCGNSVPSFQQQRHSYAQLSATIMPAGLDACVLRAGAVQIMQDPGRSRALGKSSTRREPSLASLPPSGQHQSNASGAERWGAALLRIGDDASLGGHGSHAVTPQGQPYNCYNCTKRQPTHKRRDGRRRLGASRRGIKAAARGAGRTPERVTGDAAEIR